MIAHSPASTWRDPILAQFTPDIATVARLTVVADPDELLTEQGVIDGIRQRGFEIVPFEDYVAFRYAYERRFREVGITARIPTSLSFCGRRDRTSVDFRSTSLSRRSATAGCSLSALRSCSRP